MEIIIKKLVIVIFKNILHKKKDINKYIKIILYIYIYIYIYIYAL